jgi:hypothetical protein
MLAKREPGLVRKSIKVPHYHAWEALPSRKGAISLFRAHNSHADRRINALKRKIRYYQADD